MNRSNLLMLLGLLCVSASLFAQTNASDPNTPDTTLRINSRAVLVDVLVTDQKGVPVTGLKQDAFTVVEEGKPQVVSFFEEHSAASKEEPANLPTLPPNIFSNYSPVGRPPAVNVLLLDSLNTPLEDQSYVHKQALTFLKSLRPGSRMAIFSMSLGLRFIQGFTDDPAMLVAALSNKKNNEVEAPSQMTSAQEGNAQQAVIGQMSQIASDDPHGGPQSAASPAMISALQNFMVETNTAQTSDREYRTLTNLQQLAAFLGGFPGRKNVIWFSESFPLNLFGATDQRFEGDVKKTVNLLTAARVAVYPVDARGVRGHQFFEAANTGAQGSPMPSQMSGVAKPSDPQGGTQSSDPASEGPQGPGQAPSNPLTAESSERNGNQSTMDMLAHDSGGKAFFNTNSLADVIANIVSSSADFYTISYSPENQKMDGRFRRIEVKVGGPKYTLSYRRGYYAVDSDLPGAAQSAPSQNPQNKTTGDPLRPFMDFGMPQTEQILYKTLIQPIAPGQDAAPGIDESAKSMASHYSVDFAIELKDLNLKLDTNGLHKGSLNLCLIVYDRYGHIASRKDHQVALSIKPDVYTVYQQDGVQLRAVIDVPKGQFWLRTGVYDQASHKAGTMEIPLSSVKPQEMQ